MVREGEFGNGALGRDASNPARLAFDKPEIAIRALGNAPSVAAGEGSANSVMLTIGVAGVGLTRAVGLEWLEGCESRLSA